VPARCDHSAARQPPRAARGARRRPRGAAAAGGARAAPRAPAERESAKGRVALRENSLKRIVGPLCFPLEKVGPSNAGRGGRGRGLQVPARVVRAQALQLARRHQLVLRRPRERAAQREQYLKGAEGLGFRFSQQGAAADERTKEHRFHVSYSSGARRGNGWEGGRTTARRQSAPPGRPSSFLSSSAISRSASPARPQEPSMRRALDVGGSARSRRDRRRRLQGGFWPTAPRQFLANDSMVPPAALSSGNESRIGSPSLSSARPAPRHDPPPDPRREPGPPAASSRGAWNTSACSRSPAAASAVCAAPPRATASPPARLQPSAHLKTVFWSWRRAPEPARHAGTLRVRLQRGAREPLYNGILAGTTLQKHSRAIVHELTSLLTRGEPQTRRVREGARPR